MFVFFFNDPASTQIYTLSLHDALPILSARWSEGVLLKRDVFSTVERGRFKSDAGEVDAVLRRLDEVPWWSFVLARHLFADRKSTRLNSSHSQISYAVFCLKKKKKT